MLKKNNLRKRSILSKKSTILSETELMFDLSVEALKILMYLQENLLGKGFFSVKF